MFTWLKRSGAVKFILIALKYKYCKLKYQDFGKLTR
jgi:hypothetical protein